jgi:excisionase family DNA binding protein
MSLLQSDAIRKENSGMTLCTGFATVQEAADFTKLHPSMVRKLITQGDIPARRFGRAIRIPWSWILDQAGITRPQAGAA